MKRALRISLLLVLGAALAGGGALAWRFTHRPGAGAAFPVAPAAAPGAAGITATWLGVSGVLLSDGTTRLLVDPYFSRPRGWGPLLRNAPIAPDTAAISAGLRRIGAESAAAVLVSHSHFDHALDAGAVAQASGAMLVGSTSTANIGRGAGVPESRLRVALPGAELRFGDFAVTFIESRHAGATGGAPTGDITAPLAPPARYGDYRQGGTWSIVVAHPRGRILLHGSAGYAPGALRGHRAEAVFLGVALVDTLDDYLRETVDAVGASRVFATHWDDFTVPLDAAPPPLPFGVNLPRLFAEVARLRPGLTLRMLPPWQPVLLFAAS